MRPLVLTPTGTGQLQLLRTDGKSNRLLQPLHKVLSTSLYLTLSVYVLLDVHFQNPSQSREDAFHHAEKIFRLIPAKVGPSSPSPRGGPRPRNQHHCPTSVAPPFLSFNPSHHRGESLLLLAQWEPNPIPPKGGSLTQDEWMDFCERPVPSQELVLRCVFTKKSFTCPVLLRIPLRAVVFQ